MSEQPTPLPTSAKRSTPELRAAWLHTFGSLPAEGIGRETVVRALAWKEQEKAKGLLPPQVSRELTRLAAQLDRSGDLDLERKHTLKLGTRLVRDWHGETYHVLVLKDCFLFQEQTYASLSQIAQEITGVKWSGPRFFGLSKAARAAARKAQKNG